MSSFFKDMFTPPTGKGSEEGAHGVAAAERSQEAAETASMAMPELSSQQRTELLRTFRANHPVRRRRISSTSTGSSGEPAGLHRGKSWSSASLDGEDSVEDEPERPLTQVLPESIFTDSFDAVEHGLAMYPEEEHGRETQETFLMENISRFKDILKRVQGELQAVVQANHSAMVGGMRQVQYIDMDLTRATINAKNARRGIRIATRGLAIGDLRAVHLHRKRSRAKTLFSLLEELKELVRTRNEVFELADKGDLPGAVRLCVATVQRLDRNKERHMKFTALEELRKNMSQVLPSLRMRTDDSLRSVCSVKHSEFLTSDYEAVLNAYVSLDFAISKYADEEQLKRIHETKGSLMKDQISQKLTGVADIAQNVQRIFISLAGESLRSELIAHIAAHDAATNSTNAVRARGMTLREICDILPTRASAKVSFVFRVGLGLEWICDLLANYDTIADWHAEYEVVCEPRIKALLAPHSDIQKFVENLSSAAKTLHTNRRLVWAGVVSHVATVTKSECARYPILKLPDFESLVKLLEKLTLVSKSFGGDQCFLETRAFLRETCKAYCRDFHKERVEGLKSFLGRENWQMFGISVDRFGGIQGLVHRGQETTFLSPSSSGSRAVERRLIAENCGEGEGNPFANLRANEISVSNSDKVNGVALGNDTAALSEEGESIEEGEEEIVFEKMENKNGHVRDSEDNVVLTTTILNCMSKNIGRYMTMMDFVPLVAIETFNNLRKTFSTYIVSILLDFIPETILYLVFDHPSSTFGRKYWDLRTHIEKIRGDFALGSRELRLQQRKPSTKVQARALSKATIKSSKSFKNGQLTSTSPPEFIEGVIESRVPRPLLALVHGEDDTRRSGKLSMNFVTSRVVAAESIVFSIELLSSVRTEIEEKLPAIERERICLDVFEELGMLARQSRSILLRAVAQHLIDRFDPDPDFKASLPSGILPLENRCWITRKIASGRKWASLKELRTEPNHYVRTVVNAMSKIWQCLQRTSEEGAAFPLTAIPRVWSLAACEVFDQMLDGFALVNGCTTEGRALMSLDLATAFREIQDINSTTDQEVVEAKTRVDDFIKAFYYEREQDVFEWISQNSTRYEHWHLRGLVLNGIGATMKTNEQHETALAKVDSLFEK